MKTSLEILAGLLFIAGGPALAAAQQPATLSGSQPLTMTGDLAVVLVDRVDHFLLDRLQQSIQDRQHFWSRDMSSSEAYEKSVAANRADLRRCLGVVDPRLAAPRIELLSVKPASSCLAKGAGFSVYPVRWAVWDGIFGEGLLLEPDGAPVARVVALPDADQTPEMLAGLEPGLPTPAQFARRLAENGCQVIIPTLIDRADTWSGNSALGRFSNQPHREWIYRQAFEMGRHIIGYEVQKILAAVDCLAAKNDHAHASIGVAGYGEGGLLAFYSAAVDTRIDAAWVSGYFDSRQRVWSEPIYRNVWALLHKFGDAEIASLITPRSLVIEYCRYPEVAGPPKPRSGRAGAAPGMLATPSYESVALEFERAKSFFPSQSPVQPAMQLVGSPAQALSAPGSDPALENFLHALMAKPVQLKGGSADYAQVATNPFAGDRQRRQVKELEQYTQRLLRVSDGARDQFFGNSLKPTTPAAWQDQTQRFRSNLWDEVIGRLPAANVPANPRSRQILDNAKWTAYDVVLDVWPDVFAWGVLLVPKDLQPQERRPVVVCQHGLEGVPLDTITRDTQTFSYAAYKAFSAQLAEQGYVVFAPYNLYRGQDRFRVLQRKANPLKASLFSVILAQHERILDWLSTLPMVDPQRIGFYGLSYGGKTAMRVPALLDRYALSICSADFNDWVRKNATVDSVYSYMFTGEYELPEYNLGGTFNYAEMGGLIAPRPFMVERGHHDGVAPDEWVAYEYAKVRRLYADLGIPERTAIEFFNGPHTINGVGTFAFLRTHLGWPK